MALKKAIKTGGDFLDLKDLARSGPVLAVFRLREWQPAEPGEFGPKLPVIADVLICSGPRAGEVCTSERFFGAITTALRGVKNPKKGEPIPAPTNDLGDDIAVRVKLINEGKGNESAVGDEPSDAEIETIEMHYRDGAGFESVARELVGAGAPATNGAAVNGAPVADKKPWE